MLAILFKSAFFLKYALQSKLSDLSDSVFLQMLWKHSELKYIYPKMNNLKNKM